MLNSRVIALCNPDELHLMVGIVHCSLEAYVTGLFIATFIIIFVYIECLVHNHSSVSVSGSPRACYRQFDRIDSDSVIGVLQVLSRDLS